MRHFYRLLIVIFWFSTAAATPRFIVVGGDNKPVGVYLQPFDYRGSAVSPAVAIENILLSHLSQSGLFYQPGRLQPEERWNLHHWRLAGVRYVITGDIKETERVIDLRLTITDTLGTTPTFVWVELNADAWQQATRVFARQLLYSLFYATYTDEVDSQYLQNTEPAETRYWMALVKTLKRHWHNQTGRGECQVGITQLPGGRVQSYDIDVDCETTLFSELQALFERLNGLPYGGFNAPFAQQFTVTFVAQP